MLQSTSNMGEVPVLDTLVANTAYLRAQEVDHTELRKQRIRLTLPKPKTFSALEAAGSKTYESLCEQQPIGRKLFQQFLLSSNPRYIVATEFLDELNCWSFAEDETKVKAQQRIIAKFFQPESRSFLSYLTGEDAARCKEISDKNFGEVTMGQMREATRNFLKGKPFTEYLKSPFFYRFLQWKEYEKQRITDKYFYEFRTLGKGGFGEVGTRTPSI